MKTHDCSLACNDSIAITNDMRDRLHMRCPGAYRTSASGALGWCDCLCHDDQTRDEGAMRSMELPLISEGAVYGHSPSPGEKDRPEALVAPPRPATGRQCGCGCGSPVARRFLPGHDAKLKSRLVKEARSGSKAARENLREHGWEHFI